jgi:uncharacterized protein (DUF433 family)
METEHASHEYTGSYTLREAAFYIRATVKQNLPSTSINTRHLGWWIRKGLVGSHEEDREHPPSVNFLELVSCRLVAMLRTRKITSGAIQAAHHQLRVRFGWEYPFAMQPLWVAQPDVFVELENSPVAVTHHFQSAFQFMWDYLEPVGNERHGLTFDAEEQAVAWEPHPGILLDPLVQFGEPCLRGTRIPTETLWALNQGGDSKENLAFLYDVPTAEIESALDWEEKVAEVAGARKFAEIPA